MIPTEEYSNLIRFRIQNPLPEDVKGEIHHIVPKSCGGTNFENTVRLSTLEHLLAHKLLKEIYPTGKEHRSMVFAWHLLSYTTDGVKLSDEEIVQLRQERAAAVSGENNPMKGKHLSEEARRKLSEACKGRPSPNKGKPSPLKGRKGHPSANKGKPMSEEQKQKISAAQKGKPRPYLKNHVQSEETRRKRSESIKAWHAKRKQQENFKWT